MPRAFFRDGLLEAPFFGGSLTNANNIMIDIVPGIIVNKNMPLYPKGIRKKNANKGPTIAPS